MTLVLCDASGQPRKGSHCYQVLLLCTVESYEKNHEDSSWEADTRTTDQPKNLEWWCLPSLCVSLNPPQSPNSLRLPPTPQEKGGVWWLPWCHWCSRSLLNSKTWLLQKRHLSMLWPLDLVKRRDRIETKMDYSPLKPHDPHIWLQIHTVNLQHEAELYSLNTWGLHNFPNKSGIL